MLRTSTLPIVLLFLSTAHAQLAPQATAPLAAHLLEVNTQWRMQGDAFLAEGSTAAFTNETDRIAAHLRLVREQLMQRHSESLSATQVVNRGLLLDRLGDYANEGRFPKNEVLPYRNPVFIDPYGTACAVGWLMIESGHGDLARSISAEMNLAYVLDMPESPQWPAIAGWASEHGFEATELAWIQPGYPPTTPWAPFGGGTNGTVTVLHTLANGNLLVAGSFTAAGGNAANQVALWNGTVLLPMGTGMEGEVRCAAEFNGELYVGGSMLNGPADLAKWDGTSWSFSVVFSGKLPLIHALHVHNGALHAAGETMGFAGIDHQVKRLENGIWENLGLPFNEAVLTLESFNNELVAGGAFTQALGVMDPLIPHVARFNGSEWVTMGNGLNATVRDLLVLDGALYAAGDLFANIVPTFGLARIQGNSMEWEEMLPMHAEYMSDMMGPSYFASMTEHEGTIYLGGRYMVILFTLFGNHVASFNGQPDGLTPLAFLDQPVNAVAMLDNKLVIGGEFNNTLPHLAAVDIATYASSLDPIAPEFTLFPQPATQQLTVRSDAFGAGTSMRVTDLLGRAVPVRITQGIEQVVLHLDGLTAGTYLLTMGTASGEYTRPFMKE